jgi:PAS domain-containing protein
MVLNGSTIVWACPGAVKLVGAAGDEHVVGRDVFDFLAPGWTPPGPTGPTLLTLVRLDDVQELVELRAAPGDWRGAPAINVDLLPAADGFRLRTPATGIQAEVRDAVVVTDAEFLVLSANGAAEGLYGTADGALLGRFLGDVLGPRYDEEFFEVLLDELHWRGEWSGEILDGTSTTVTVLRDGGGQSVGTTWVTHCA